MLRRVWWRCDGLVIIKEKEVKVKITLTYETQVNYVVDLDTEKVESITVVKEYGSHITGYEGFINVESNSGSLSIPDVKKAISILKTTKSQPKWQVK